MRHAVRSTVAAASVLFVLLVPAPPAHACSCANLPLEQHVKTATTVFVGRAEDAKEAPAGLVTRFGVSAVYKGPVVRRVEVTTPPDEAACGVPFLEGRSYAVFARHEGGRLTTTLCAGTTDDLATIAGLRPLALLLLPSPRAAPDDTPSGASRTAPIAIAGLLVALVSAGSALAVRAARRPRPIA